ncbi:MAG: hypothetical protein WC521_05030 [Bdellovibrionales bacterium]
MNAFKSLSLEELDQKFKTGIEFKLRNGTFVTIKYADANDFMEIAHLVQRHRLYKDPKPKGYISAAIRQKNEEDLNFFEAQWKKVLDKNHPSKTLKAVHNGKIVGIARGEAYKESDSADIVAALKAASNSALKPSFDLVEINKNINQDEWINAKWSEMHQFYLDADKKYQGNGLGTFLWGAMTSLLGKSGCTMMLINAMDYTENEPSRQTLKYLEDRGSVCGANIVEHNTRDGIEFLVPCRLYGCRL